MSFPCWVCGSDDSELVLVVDAKPTREIDHGIVDYYREIRRCRRCDVHLNAHDLLPDEMYAGDYNASIDSSGLQRRYDRVRSLPRGESDNVGRVDRIVAFVEDRGRPIGGASVLDIGSGTAVFGGEIRDRGAEVTVLDPDPTAVRHAVDYVGLNGEVASLGALPDVGRFHVVTLNKVLEHVKAPVDALAEAAERLTDDGVLYVELPDGDAAAAAPDIDDRPELFVEHYTAFGDRSIRELAERAGLRVLHVERLVDPSGKFTIYAFLART
jgi:2-polyprenyl-3-methyl-5-hydroxy-6-metoxy-1,4-benzoquinol methylase